MSVGDPPEAREPDVAVGGVSVGGGSVETAASASARRIVAARAVSLALVFVGSIVLSRTLGPDGRGAHAFYVALVILLAAVLGLSSPSGGYILTSRHGVEGHELGANSIWIALIGGVLAAIGAFIAQAIFGFMPAALDRKSG